MVLHVLLLMRFVIRRPILENVSVVLQALVLDYQPGLTVMQAIVNVSALQIYFRVLIPQLEFIAILLEMVEMESASVLQLSPVPD